MTGRYGAAVAIRVFQTFCKSQFNGHLSRQRKIRIVSISLLPAVTAAQTRYILMIAERLGRSRARELL